MSWSKQLTATNNTQALVNRVKGEVQSKITTSLTLYTAVAYIWQDEGGNHKNYVVKVQATENDYIHIQLCDKDEEVTLFNVTDKETMSTPIYPPYN